MAKKKQSTVKVLFKKIKGVAKKPNKKIFAS